MQAELSNPYQMHRTLMSVFPAQLDSEERLLYRLETSHTLPYLVILLQSRLAPDWSALERKGYLLQPAQVKTFDLQFRVGQRLAFRLAANPTKRLKSAVENEPGKRVSLYRPEEQQVWLLRKAQQNGFSVLSMQVTNLSNQLAFKQCKGKRMKITLHGVRFDGVLCVEQPDLFTLALEKGIGSAKGFGFGLLSLAPLPAAQSFSRLPAGGGSILEP